MARYQNPTTGLVEEVGNPNLNPDLIKGKTLVSDTTPLGYPQTYNPTTPTIITPASLEPISGLPYVNPNQSMFSLPNEPEPLTATTQETQQSDLIKQLQDLSNQEVGKSAYRTEQETARGIPELQKTKTDLTSQYKSLQNELQAAQLAYNYTIPNQMQVGAEGRGITVGGLQPLTASELRKNQIYQGGITSRALGVSALLDATNGLLTSAQDKADRAVAAKYDPITEKINALTANLNLILKDPATTLAEKNRAQAQLDIQTKAKEANDLAKTNATEVWNVATSAASYIANFTPTPDYPTASVALDKISKAKTKEEALRIATETGLTIKPTEQWSTPYLMGGDYVQKNTKTGEIRTAAGAGTETNPLSVLDIARYNELYPDAGVIAGDTETQANQKVIKSTQPRDFTDDEIRSLVSDDKTKDKTYEEVVAAINAFPTLKNKERALLIAAELYGKAPKVPKVELKSKTGGSTTPMGYVPEQKTEEIYKFLFSPTG